MFQTTPARRSRAAPPPRPWKAGSLSGLANTAIAAAYLTQCAPLHRESIYTLQTRSQSDAPIWAFHDHSSHGTRIVLVSSQWAAPQPSSNMPVLMMQSKFRAFGQTVFLHILGFSLSRAQPPPRRQPTVRRRRDLPPATPCRICPPRSAPPHSPLCCLDEETPQQNYALLPDPHPSASKHFSSCHTKSSIYYIENTREMTDCNGNHHSREMSPCHASPKLFQFLVFLQSILRANNIRYN